MIYVRVKPSLALARAVVHYGFSTWFHNCNMTVISPPISTILLISVLRFSRVRSAHQVIAARDLIRYRAKMAAKPGARKRRKKEARSKTTQNGKISQSVKSKKQSYFYKLNKRWKRSRKANLHGIPPELRLRIFEYFLKDPHMDDGHTFRNGDFRRKYSAQSLLLVNKLIREEASEVLFRTCIFHIHHFRLHTQHRWKNSSDTLNRVQNLTIKLTPRKNKWLVSRHSDPEIVLSCQKLKHLTIEFHGFKLIHVPAGDRQKEQYANLHKYFKVMRRPGLPKWVVALIANAPQELPICFVYWFYSEIASDQVTFSVS